MEMKLRLPIMFSTWNPIITHLEENTTSKVISCFYAASLVSKRYSFAPVSLRNRNPIERVEEIAVKATDLINSLSINFLNIHVFFHSKKITLRQ